MSYTNPKASAAANYVAAQERRDCCGGCLSASAIPQAHGVAVHCTQFKRRVAKGSFCDLWQSRARPRASLTHQEQSCSA